MASSTIGTSWLQIKPSLSGISGQITSALNSSAGNAGTSAGNMFSGKWAVAMGAIGGITSQVFSNLSSSISQHMDGAIKRVDILNNFPKVMANLGIASDDAAASINKMSDKLLGLPTSLNDAASAVQRLTSKNGDVSKSTDMFLALNNAILAGGASAELQSTALEQISQAYAKGKPDMMEWRSMLNAMPAQLNQVAQSMGYGANNASALGEDLRSGKVSMDTFMDAITRLNTEGTDGFLNFEQQARNATGGIGTTLTNLGNRIEQGLGNILNAIGVENIATAIDSIGTLMAKLGGVLGGAINVIKENKVAFEALAIAIIGVGAAYVTSGILDKFSMLSKLLAIMPSNLTGVGAAFIQVGGAFGAIGNSMWRIGNVGNALSGIFKTLWSVLRANPLITIVSLVGVAAAALGIFGTQTETGRKFFENFGQTVSNIAAKIPEIFSKIASVAGEAIGFLATKIPEIVGTLAEKIPEVIEQLATGGFADNILKFGDTVAAKMPEVIGKITTSLVSVINSISDFIASHSADFSNTVTSIVQGISSAISTALPSIINAIVAALPGIINAITTMLPNLIELIITVLETVVNALIDNLEMIINAVLTIILAIAGAIINNLPAILEAGLRILMALIEGIVNNLPMIINAIINLIISLANAIIDNLPTILAAAVQIIFTLVGALIGAIPQLIGAGIQLIGGLIGGIGQMIGSVGAKIGEIGKNILDGIGNFFHDMVEAGKNLIKGLIEGIGNMIGAVKNKVEEVANSVMDNIKSFFGIQSPSKEMAKVGDFLMQGLAKGIGENTKNAVKAAKSAASSVLGAFGDGGEMDIEANAGGSFANEYALSMAPVNADMFDSNSQGGADRTVKNVFNINGYNKDPQELANIISHKIALSQRGVL